MKTQDYTASIEVNMAAAKVYETINNVALWWTDQLTGDSHQVNDEFTVQFGDVHVSTQKVIELAPAKKIVAGFTLQGVAGFAPLFSLILYLVFARTKENSVLTLPGLVRHCLLCNVTITRLLSFLMKRATARIDHSFTN